MNPTPVCPPANWTDVDPMAVSLVPEWFARARNVFPLRYSARTLWVATPHPEDVVTEADLAFASGRDVQFELASATEIEAAWAAGNAAEPGEHADSEAAVKPAAIHGKPTTAGTAANRARVAPPQTRQAPDDATSEGAEELAEVGDDSPIAKLAHRLLDEGLSLRASDLHVEPLPSGGMVRARVDGVLQRIATVPDDLYRRLVSRYKVKGDLDIADRVRPQDGRSTHMRGPGDAVELRISAIPTRDGEKLVIRFLDPGNVRTFEELGLLARETEALQRLLDCRDGIVALTGPTGAGKTSTLYAALGRLDTASTNVCTVEDPIEYRLPGASQVQVNVARGVTFASALRAFLRQDPDVILLGEIRDAETAGVAVQAALTGHLVLTTLHTNDAVAALARLHDLGVDAAAVADALRGVVAQRLVRKLCPDCSVPAAAQVEVGEAVLERRYGVSSPRRPVGCDKCRGTGYRGRIAVAEVLSITGAVADGVRAAKPAAVIRAEARKAGVRSMREVALELVKEGKTTLDEVHRVLGELDPVHDQAVEAGGRVGDDPAAPGDAPTLPPPAATREDRDASASGAAARSAPTGTRAALGLTGHWDGPTGQWLLSRKQGPVVLLADQDEADLLAVERHLTSRGWRVTTATDGEEARRYLKSQSFDLAILRLRLPLLSGREILQRLQSGGRSALPVLILTNLTSDDVERELLAEGADDFIRKPVKATELERRALAVLRRRYPEKFAF